MLYVGRIVCVGVTPSGRVCAGYRVSSRSFPNRRAVQRDSAISIVPKPGHESDIQKNPYIAYNCARVARLGQVAVLTNGSQTDPIAEKIDAGMPVRDALVLSLLALDYEHDAYNTPRICAVADRRDGSTWLATVRGDGLNVRKIPIDPGKFAYVATYEENDIGAGQMGAFGIESPDALCGYLIGEGVFAHRSNPVSAIAAVATEEGFAMAYRDVEAERSAKEPA